ncbi:MAG: hypothetical protein ACOH16_15175 [Propionibacteriaceae bacterium]|jgi:hypothetical protein
MPATTSRSLVVLRLAAALSSLIGLVQAGLGFSGLPLILAAPHDEEAGAAFIDPHGILGYSNLLVMIVAAVAALIWYRKGGSKGLMMHAFGMVVIFVAQVGLGSAGVLWVHVVLGVLAVLGSIALAVLAYRKPGGTA